MTRSLHKLVELTVRRVLEKNPSFNWISAYQDVQDLNDLAWAIDHPPTMEKIAALDIPIRCGNVTLWRLSYAAVEWLTHCGEKWYEGNPRMINLMWAWAMAHSRDPAAIRAAWTDPDTGMRIVGEWLLSTQCPVEALLEAVNALIPKPADESPEPGATPAECGEIIDTLISEYGGTADHWLFEVSGETLRDLWSRIEARKVSEMIARIGIPLNSIDKERKQRAHWRYSQAAKKFEAKWATTSVS
jgi:hypothetical protein